MSLWQKAGEQAKAEYKGKDTAKLALVQKRIYCGMRRQASEAVGSPTSLAMAPASRSGKRTSKAATPPTAKKPRTDSNVVGVLDALKQADLSPACKAMLAAGVPVCLATPPAERHEIQDNMISWMDTVFNSVQAKLQEALDSAEQSVASANSKKEDLEGKASGAQSVYDAKGGAVKEKQAGLATANEAVLNARASFKAAVAAQKSGEAELAKASESKQKLETAMSEHLSYLKTEEGFEAKHATAHMKKLTPTAKQLKLDDSLLTALPSAASVAPGKRGDFDRMVIEQLEAGIQGKVDELDAQLKNGEAAASERSAAVAAAQGEVEKAEEAEGNAKSAVAAAEAEEKQAKEAFSAAAKERDAGMAEYNEASSAKDERAMAMDNFKNYNLECYKALRNKEAAEEEAPAES